MPITITIQGDNAAHAVAEIIGLAGTMARPEVEAAATAALAKTLPDLPEVVQGEVLPPQPKKRTSKKSDPAPEPKPEELPPVITVEELQAENAAAEAGEPVQTDIEDAASKPDFDTYAANVRALLESEDFKDLDPITEENARKVRDVLSKLYDAHGDDASRETLKLFGGAKNVSGLRNAHTSMFCEYATRLKEELSRQKAEATREARKSNK